MILSQFQTATGLVQIKILSNHESNAHTANIGSLNYSFDQTPDTLSIDRVQALYTYVNVDLLQYDDKGVDLWEVLTQETNVGQLQVEFTLFVPDGGFEFLFRLRKADISLNEKSGVVTLRLTPLINESLTAEDIFDQIATKKTFRTREGSRGDIDPSNVVNAFYPCVSTQDYILTSLNSLFENGYNNIYVPSKTDVDGNYPEFLFSEFDEGKLNFVMVEASVDNGIDPAPLDDAEPIDGSGSLFVEDRTDYADEGHQAFPDYQLRIVGIGVQALQRGDEVYVKNGSKIGDQVNVVRQIGGTWEAFLSATEMTMPVGRGGSTTFNAWTYLRGEDPIKQKAVSVLKDMAGVEGSIFGTGFSSNWYIHRLTIDEIGDNTVTLNWNEVIESKPFALPLSIGKSFVGQLASWRDFGRDQFGQVGRQGQNSGVPNLERGRYNTNGNPNATKGIEIELAPAYPFLSKGIVDGANVDGLSLRGVDSNLESALTRNGLKSYFQSLNSTKDSISVEFEVIGALRVLPYNLIQFDSRAPERYQDKQFRITQVAYDFVNDKAKIKAYQISSITTPSVDDPRPRVPPPGSPVPPPPPPPPPTSGFLGFTNRGYSREENGGLGIDEIELRLNAPLENGKEYWIINRRQLSNTNVFTGIYAIIPILETQYSATGVVTIPIERQVVDAPQGSFVVLAPAQIEADQIVTEVTQEFLSNQVDINSQAISTLSTLLNVEVGNVVAIAEQITELTTRVDGFESNINVATELVQQLSSQVIIIEGDITAQGQAITSINSVIENLESNVTGQATAITNLNTRVTSAEGNIVSIAGKVDIVESNIINLDSKINIQATAISAINTNVSLLGDNITSLAGAITQINSNVTNIEGDIDAQSNAISALNTRVDVAEGNITSLSGAITQINSNITNVESNLAIQATALNQLNTRVTFNESNITALSVALTTVEAGVGELERNADGSDEVWDDSEGVWNIFDQYFLTGFPASARGLSLLSARVTQNEDGLEIVGQAITGVQSNLDSEVQARASAINQLDTRILQNENDIIVNASSLTAIESRLQDGAFEFSASAFLSLETNVSNIDGRVTVNAEALLQVEADFEDLEGDVEGINTAVSGLQLQVGNLDQDISNAFSDIGTIGARSVLFTDVNGNIASIELLSGTAGSAIDINASQVKINGVIFDDEGNMRSTSFDGTIVDGIATSFGTDGWSIDREGLIVAHNIVIRGGSITDVPELDDLKDDLDDLGEDLDDLKDDLGDLEINLNNLNTVVLPALQDDLDDLETDLNTLNTVTLPALQQELDDVLPITEVKIADDAISAPKLQANSVVAGKIAANAVTANEIASNTITANEISAGTITANEIASNTITANQIASDTITANEIAVGTITANEIGAGAITTEKIGAGQITSEKIGANEIKSNNIEAGAVTANKISVINLQAVSTKMGTLDVDDVLTMGVNGEIVGSNYTISREGLSVDADADFDITLGSGSEITNTAGNFQINQNGFAVYGFTSDVTTTESKAYKLLNTVGTNWEGVLADIGSRITLRSRVLPIRIRSGSGIEIFNDATSDISIDAGQDVRLEADRYMRMIFNDGNADVRFDSATNSGTDGRPEAGRIVVRVNGVERFIKLYGL